MHNDHQTLIRYTDQFSHMPTSQYSFYVAQDIAIEITKAQRLVDRGVDAATHPIKRIMQQGTQSLAHMVGRQYDIPDITQTLYLERDLLCAYGTVLNGMVENTTKRRNEIERRLETIARNIIAAPIRPVRQSFDAFGSIQRSQRDMQRLGQITTQSQSRSQEIAQHYIGLERVFADVEHHARSLHKEAKHFHEYVSEIVIPFYEVGIMRQQMRYIATHMNKLRQFSSEIAEHTAHAIHDIDGSMQRSIGHDATQLSALMQHAQQ